MDIKKTINIFVLLVLLLEVFVFISAKLYISQEKEIPLSGEYLPHEKRYSVVTHTYSDKLRTLLVGSVII